MSALGIDAALLDDVVKRDGLRFELYSIAFSHYNERARWALEFAGIPFQEHKYLPLFHVLPVALVQRQFALRSAGKDNTASTPFSTPTLAIYDARGTPLLCLPDSSLICRFASAYSVHRGGQSLYHVPDTHATAPAEAPPARDQLPLWVEDPDIAALDQAFHDRLGPATRCIAYRYFLPSLRAAALTDWNSVGPVQAICHILLFPLVALLLWFSFKLGDTARRQRHFATIDAQLQLAADSQASHKSKHICRDTLTAADITCASLAAVVLAVTSSEGYGSYFPPADTVGREFAEYAARLRSSPGGKCVMDAYGSRHARGLPAGSGLGTR